MHGPGAARRWHRSGDGQAVTKRTTGAAKAAPASSPGRWVTLPIPLDEGPLSADQRAVKRLADGDECRVRDADGREYDAVVDAKRGYCFRTLNGLEIEVYAVLAPGRPRSGPNIPEAQRGTVQLHLRVPAAVLAQLDALCVTSSLTRSALVAHLIGRE